MNNALAQDPYEHATHICEKIDSRIQNLTENMESFLEKQKRGDFDLRQDDQTKYLGCLNEDIDTIFEGISNQPQVFNFFLLVDYHSLKIGSIFI